MDDRHCILRPSTSTFGILLLTNLCRLGSYHPVFIVQRLRSDTTIRVSFDRPDGLRVCNSLHDTTGSSSTGVTSLERVGVTALSEIIGTGVNDDGSANDGLSTEQGDVLVCG